MGGSLSALAPTFRSSAVVTAAEPVVKEYDVAWRDLDWDKNDNVKKILREFKPCSEQLTCFRFILQGTAGAGKSSIINSINMTFKGRVDVNALASAGGRSHSFTTTYTTHKIEDKDGKALPFVFNDIMGLEAEEKSGTLPADIISALKGHVMDGYKFNPHSPLTNDGDRGYYKSSPTVNDKVHCLVNVIPADTIILRDASFLKAIKKMKEVREAASDLGMPQVIFMTHVDTCCPLVKGNLKSVYKSKKIKQAMEICSTELGVPMNCIFPVKNYHEEIRVNDQIDCLILEALNQIVNFANDYVRKIGEI